MKEDPKSLRGEAAWRASKAEIAKRNDAAREAGGRRRAAKEAEELQAAGQRERREAQNRPTQPGR